jgi:TRAP-type transport system periplasmic protein
VIRFVVLLSLLAAPAAADVEIRIASLAPAGSSWAKTMSESSTVLEHETEGRVRLKFYFSGSQGDERDVVRKMKLDQLDGAALTAVGLGMIQPDLLVLELPYLFTSDAQVDHVRAKLGPDFEKELADAGYVLVSWGDVGWVHTYFTTEIRTPAELAALRFWEWTDDPISREMLEILGVNGVPLGLPDVLQALQTGTIQACAAPPLAAVALQWYPKLKYMTDRPPAYAIGALVIKKPVLDRLAPGDRERLLRGGRETGARLTAGVRRDNERAKNAMLRSGVVMVHIPDETQARLVAAGKQVWQRLAGKLYSKELLEKVIQAVAEAP